MTSDLRIGFGVDYHQIQKGNSMILGGIKIDCGYSILAHSDGDIILHSICDALLGAASMGDLGLVFKEDESTENISSSVLLNQVLNLLSRGSYEVVNPPNPSQETIKSDARMWRNEELANTDRVAQTPDFPNRDKYLTYRQALRDWPSTSDFPETRPTL
mgnify:CR=1 FL=1